VFGDDANPCRLSAPCRTFAGAISKTAAGGEIEVLNSGDFGGVTITKSITISAEEVEARVLVAGTNGIVIKAPTTSTVVLRGLDIEGLGTGLVGIKVLGGLGALHVEKCSINNFRGSNSSGIEIATTAAGTTQVYIKDTNVRNSGQGTGVGVLIKPTGSAVVKASLDNVRLENNNAGLQVQGSSTTMVNDSTAAGNVNAGFSNAGGGTTALSLSHSVSTGNGTFGVVCGGGSATTSLGDISITGNATGNTTGTCS
jgi:nitrous oxidase accessory protein NosD